MNYKLYNGDCLEIMKDIPNKTIDLVLIDPPYNIGKDFGNNKDTWNILNEIKNGLYKPFEF